VIPEKDFLFAIGTTVCNSNVFRRWAWNFLSLNRGFLYAYCSGAPGLHVVVHNPGAVHLDSWTACATKTCPLSWNWRTGHGTVNGSFKQGVVVIGWGVILVEILVEVGQPATIVLQKSRTSFCGQCSHAHFFKVVPLVYTRYRWWPFRVIWTSWPQSCSKKTFWKFR